MADPDSPDFDPREYVHSRLAAASNAEAQEQFTEELDPMNKSAQGTNALGKWMQKLPRNVTIGMFDAALANAQFVEDVRAKTRAATPGATAALRTTGPVGVAADVLTKLPPIPEDVMQSLRGFRDHFAGESTTGDVITQSLAQFAIPFAGWARALGVARGLPMASNILRGAGAEIATSSTVLEPHAGRLADVLALGRHTEGRLGDALRAIAPDDSLVNAYINYMTERDGEGEWEGRFKNSVDSLVTSAALAGILKTAAVSFKGARKLLSPTREAPRRDPLNPSVL